MAKVLLVEDHPDIRRVLRVQLEWMGLTVILAKNGKEGFDTAIAEKPDLILMNSMMPEMDGWQANRVLRANPETKDIPILAATAMSESPISRTGLTPDATITSSSHLRPMNSKERSRL